MTANTTGLPTLSDFEAFLEVHGPNRSRWPAQKRLAFASLLASAPEARRLLAEAEALERLIESAVDDQGAGTDGASHSARIDRIMQAALADEPRLERAPEAPTLPAIAPQPAAANVVPLRPARRKSVSRSPVSWPVGAMMAASLLLGLTTGLTTMTSLGSSIDVAANESAADQALDPAVIALDNDSYGPLGGDLL